MAQAYVVRNQLGHYWGKAKRWVDGSDPKAVLRVSHEDEAVNTLFELSSKDFELRGEVLAVALSERGEPVVEPSEHLLPEPEPDPVAPETVAENPDPAAEANRDSA